MIFLIELLILILFLFILFRDDERISSASMSLNLDPDRDDLNESICSVPKGDIPNKLPLSYDFFNKKYNELSNIERLVFFF